MEALFWTNFLKVLELIGSKSHNQGSFSLMLLRISSSLAPAMLDVCASNTPQSPMDDENLLKGLQ
jgi:hypothetical protein